MQKRNVRCVLKERNNLIYEELKNNYETWCAIISWLYYTPMFAETLIYFDKFDTECAF